MTNEEIAIAFREILKAIEMTGKAADEGNWSFRAGFLGQARDHMEKVRELLPEHLLERLGKK